MLEEQRSKIHNVTTKHLHHMLARFEKIAEMTKTCFKRPQLTTVACVYVRERIMYLQLPVYVLTNVKAVLHSFFLTLVKFLTC